MNSLYGNYRNFKFHDIWDNANDFVADYKDSGLYASTNKITDTNANTLFYLLYARYANSTVASSDPTQFQYKVFSIIFEYGPTWEKRLDIQNTLRNLSAADIKAGLSEARTNSRNGSNSSTSDVTTNGSNSNTSNITGSNTGTKIVNHASNPSTAPAASSDTPLTYIDGQDYNKDVQSNTSTNTATLTIADAQHIVDSGSNLESGSASKTVTKGSVEAYTLLWDLLKTDVTKDFIDKFKSLFLTIVEPELPLWYITELVDED